MTNALFNMNIKGGWFSSKPTINTTAGWDPLFALMVGYLCAFEFSPKAIKSALKSDPSNRFPENPP